jgi:hypothetical protein
MAAVRLIWTMRARDKATGAFETTEEEGPDMFRRDTTAGGLSCATWPTSGLTITANAENSFSDEALPTEE